MRGPRRTKRLYRVVIEGMGYSVIHYQDKWAAIQHAQDAVTKTPGLTARVYESKIIEWGDDQIDAYGKNA